jgi:hypothetical protein
MEFSRNRLAPAFDRARSQGDIELKQCPAGSSATAALLVIQLLLTIK